MSIEVVGLVLGDGKAMGGLETFGGSVVVGIDVIAIVVIVVVVIIGKAGDTSFTRARWWVDVHCWNDRAMKKPIGIALSCNSHILILKGA